MKNRNIVVALTLGVCLVGREALAAPITSFAAFQAAAGSLTTVTFEDLVGGSIITGSEYAGDGLTISQRDGQPIRVAFVGDGSFASPLNFNSGLNGLTSSAIPGLPSGYDDSKSENYDFTFGDLAASAGLWVGNLNPGFNTTSVDFLGEGGVLLGSISLTTADPNLISSAGQYDNRVFVGLTSPTGIRTIRLNNAARDVDGLVIDDVSFASLPSPGPPDPVPEPGTLMLLGTGLVSCLGGVRRNRRH